MQRGSLIIYDNNGKIWVNTGDAEGDILPHTLPVGLPYIETKFGELTGKIVKSVDVTVTPHKLVLEDIPKVETEEEKLKREKEELENQLLLQADKNLDGGIL